MQDKPIKQVGRPAIYTEKLAVEICELLALGLTMKKICSLPNMPDITTIFLWEIKMGNSPNFPRIPRLSG